MFLEVVVETLIFLTLVALVTVGVCLKLRAVMETYKVLQALEASDQILREYESKYVSAVRLATDNFGLSDRSVEQCLLSIHAAVSSRRALLENLKDERHSSVLRRAARSEIMEQLQDLLSNDGRSPWQQQIETHVRLIISLLSEKKRQVAGFC